MRDLFLGARRVDDGAANGFRRRYRQESGAKVLVKFQILALETIRCFSRTAPGRRAGEAYGRGKV